MRAYLLSLFLVLSFFIAYQDIKPNTPPFESLSISRGIIDFANPVKRGSLLVIKQENSRVQYFSCNGGKNSDVDCVRQNEQEKYRGRNAKVWWFKHKGLLNNYTKLAQLEVEGVVVISYLNQKESYDAFSFGHQVMNAFLIVMIMGYFLWMPLWHFSNQNITSKGA